MVDFPTFSSRTHTLRGPQPTGVGLRLIVAGMDRTDEYESLSFGNNSPGGYGPCQFLVRSNPPNFGDPINITVNGQEAWVGSVVNTPGVRYVGEHEPTYNVIGDGPGKQDAASQSSNFAMAFVDRNLSNWFQVDCKNWSESKSALQLDCAASDFLRIGGSDTKFLVAVEDKPSKIYGFEAAVGEPGDEGYVPAFSTATNDPSTFGWSDGDFPYPPTLWAAFYYVPNQGVTADVITTFECDARWNLLTPLTDALTIPNWDAPIPMSEPDSDPPRLLPERCWPPSTQNMWTGLYDADLPECLFGGIYAVDQPEELPVRDARAMYSHSSKLQLFNKEGSTGEGERAAYVEGGVKPEGGVARVEDPINSNNWYWIDDEGAPIYTVPPGSTHLTLSLPAPKKMLVFYMAYRAVRYPKPCGLMFDEDAEGSEEGDAFYKFTTWAALNRIFLEGNMYIQLNNVSVYCNNFYGNNVSAALNLITPGDYPSFGVDSKTSIMVEPFTTRLGAVESLLQLLPQKVVWGYWHNKETLEAQMGNYGTIYLDASQPGVTVEATLKKADSGSSSETVGGMTVVYSKGHGSEDNRTIHAWTAQYVIIDADGVITEGFNEVKSGYLDLSGTAHSGESAVGAGISYIEESGGGSSEGGMQWEGSISLRSIYGAALLKAGFLVNCGDVEGALITSVSIDVDGDSVSLSLGGTGYQGRFDPAPGLGPGSATPFQTQVVLPLKSIGASRKG